MIVVVFQPHTAKMFFGMPVNILRDRNVALSDIGDMALLDLAKKIEDCEDQDACIDLIESYLCKRLIHET